MKIETKFDLGQTVYKISQRCEPYRDTCERCNGEGEFAAAKGEPIRCPDCGYAVLHGHEKGTVQKFREEAWLVECALTIGKIQAERYSTTGGDPDSTFCNMKPGTHDDKTGYMCWETGVGSGSVHYEDTIFATKEEAQEECDRRNSDSSN